MDDAERQSFLFLFLEVEFKLSRNYYLGGQIMQGEIVTVGTELLLGKINNTNATYLARQMADLGIDAHYQTVIGDNINRISETLKKSLNRADIVILCGGLGPTTDDQTKEGVAKALNVRLLTDTSQMAKITNYFDKQKRVMVDTNRKQAEYLDGAMILQNPAGLAIGDFYINENGADVVVLPGPPVEMKAMFETALKPALIKQYSLNTHIVSRSLYFAGISESELMDGAEKIAMTTPLISIGSYSQAHAIEIRLTATNASMNNEITSIERQLINKYANFYLSDDVKDNLAQLVVDKLKEHQQTITAAESLTAGLFQATICTISGASNVFNGGFVTYANDVKEKILGIDHSTISEYGVVSEPVAIEMAERSRQIMDADYGVSFTGVAGPDSLENQVPGTVWVGISKKDGHTITKQLSLPATDDRQTIREKSVWQVLYLLYLELK